MALKPEKAGSPHEADAHCWRAAKGDSAGRRHDAGGVGGVSESVVGQSRRTANVCRVRPELLILSGVASRRLPALFTAYASSATIYAVLIA